MSNITVPSLAFDYDKHVVLDRKSIGSNYLVIRFGTLRPFVAQAWSLDRSNNLHLFKELYLEGIPDYLALDLIELAFIGQTFSKVYIVGNQNHKSQFLNRVRGASRNTVNVIPSKIFVDMIPYLHDAFLESVITIYANSGNPYHDLDTNKIHEIKSLGIEKYFIKGDNPRSSIDELMEYQETSFTIGSSGEKLSSSNFAMECIYNALMFIRRHHV